MLALTQTRDGSKTVLATDADAFLLPNFVCSPSEMRSVEKYEVAGGDDHTGTTRKNCACNRWCYGHCEAPHHSPRIVARVPLHLTSNDANHGQFRRLFNTVLETGSDILQTPSIREEALNFVVGPSQLGGTHPEGEPEPGKNLQGGQNRRHLCSQCTCPLLRHTPLFFMDDSEPAADLWFFICAVPQKND